MIIVSCEKTINMEIPNKGRKLVLNSIINDTGFVSVSLHKSRFILDNSDFPIVNNATIVLWENNIIVDTLIETGNGIYSSKIIPKKENKYFIEAKKEDLIVSSETIMPNSVNAYIRDTLRINKDQNNYLRVRITIEDPGNIENYYAVGVNFIPNDTITKFNGFQYNLYYSIDENVFDFFDGTLALLSDKKFNGANFTANLYFEEYMLGYLDGHLQVYIMNVHKDLYQYIVSSNNQVYSFSPFSEPVFVPNNIKGGYGIFSSLTIQSDSIKLTSNQKPPFAFKKRGN